MSTKEAVITTLFLGLLIGYLFCFFAFRPFINNFKTVDDKINKISMQIEMLASVNAALTVEVSKLNKKFKRIDNVMLTGYSNDHYSINVPAYRDGRTATNTIARPGVIAVDPDRIPFGSLVYIFNMGWYVAEDTGQAMRDNDKYHIDVFFKTRKEALQFGKRTGSIYLLI